MDGPPSFHDGISIEESHRLLDDAIAQHWASILVLRSQKNCLAPISRLPPEILSRIFLIVKVEEHMIYRSNWIAVTHVSSHWRRVAINSSCLWIDPPLENPRWVEEMLRRSLNANLVIDANLGSDKFGTNKTLGLELALKHSWRIKYLSIQEISNITVTAWDNLQKALPKFAPQLEYLCVANDWSTGPPGLLDYTTHDRITLSDEVFCEMPRLRHLVLSQCNLKWASHPFLLPTLTHLTLRNFALDSRPTGKQFMDALKGMPNLQLLDIRYAFPVDRYRDTESIYLSSLQTLFVHSHLPEAETFLRCVTFPPTTIGNIKCLIDTTATADTDISGVMSGISRSYSIPFRILYFRKTPYKNGVLLRLFTNAVDERKPEYLPDAAGLELAFVWLDQFESPERYIGSLMVDILNCAPLQDVVMHINLAVIGKSLSVSTIANTFGTLPQVRCLRASMCSSRNCVGALELGSYTGETGLIDQVGKLYFPNLSYLSLFHTHFEESDLPEHRQHPYSVSFESLKNCLVRRSESGAKIEKLILDHYWKPESYSLSQIVGKVQLHNDFEDEDDLEEEEDYDGP